MCQYVLWYVCVSIFCGMCVCQYVLWYVCTSVCSVTYVCASVRQYMSAFCDMCLPESV